MNQTLAEWPHPGLDLGQVSIDLSQATSTGFLWKPKHPESCCKNTYRVVALTIHCIAGHFCTRNISYTGQWRHLIQYGNSYMNKVTDILKVHLRLLHQFSHWNKFRTLFTMYENVRIYPSIQYAEPLYAMFCFKAALTQTSLPWTPWNPWKGHMEPARTSESQTFEHGRRSSRHCPRDTE